ncbi:MAG: type II toxin-antitoxin system mRNA interferase toxin, RelE/StbE family [Candidatus Aenigmarchaeota archaeon]|nr:type II toxin-antitoxin system mRNA interferase toxin, RelE/StbE family [Candidatus Aenigmarchaeota archaeon]
MYELIFDKQFKKDLEKLDKTIRKKILKKVYQLEKYPELGKHLIGVNLWSLRVGKYRVLYRIVKKQLQILVLTVEHRKIVYKMVARFSDD